jgi:hypothetical protein
MQITKKKLRKLKSNILFVYSVTIVNAIKFRIPLLLYNNIYYVTFFILFCYLFFPFNTVGIDLVFSF